MGQRVPAGATLEVAETRGVARIAVAGELDADTSTDLMQEARTWLDSGVDVVIDGAGVTFTDSSALSVLLQLASMAGRRHRSFRIECPSDVLLGTARMAGVLDMLSLSTPGGRPSGRD